MAKNIGGYAVKINPNDYLNEDELYLQHFWEPTKGNIVAYQNKVCTIKEIENDQAILNEVDQLIWLQDLGWKPTLDDCDIIAMKFNAQICGNQIMFRKNEQKCFFERPNELSEYVDIIRNLRVLSSFQELK